MEISGGHMTTRLRESLLNQEQSKTHEKLVQQGQLSNQVYALNRPRILLEQVSKRTASLVFLITYVFFVGCFGFDLSGTLRQFRDASQILSVNQTISNPNDCVIKYGQKWNCYIVPTNSSNQSSTWVGSIADVGNVISVSLEYYASDNRTDSSAFTINYDVALYACLDSTFCPISNATKSSSFQSGIDAWEKVLTLQDQYLAVDEVAISDKSSKTYDLEIFGNTFQNQEALPINGQIIAYLVIISYNSDNLQPLNPLYYDFSLVTRGNTPVANALLPVILFFTIITFIAYLYALYKHNPNHEEWLAEQKWIIFYLIALILYQNPVYCVLVFLDDPTSQAVFGCYLLDCLAQASFFTIWLFFANALQRKTNYVLFYSSKIFFGLILAITQIVVLALQFPSLDPLENRSSVESVQNWSRETKQTFITFSLAFLMLLCIWTVWFFFSLWKSFSAMNKLPYMTTRHIQLSFRYFFLQGTLVATYYIFQYFVVIYLILANTPPSVSQSLESITDNVNTLFRQQSQLFGRVVFLSTYAFLLAFLFLPASFHENEAVAALSSTFVIDESEVDEVKFNRKIAILKLKKLRILTDFVKAKPDIFCVDRALNLLDVAYEAYYDPSGVSTDSGFGSMDIDRHDYKMVDFKYDSLHETFCFIARHKKMARVVVAFRGTSNRKHWNDNLNYKKRCIKFEDLILHDLDDRDGLSTYMDELVADLVEKNSSYLRRSSYSLAEDDDDSEPRLNKSYSIMEYVEEGTNQVRTGIETLAKTVVGATNTVVGTTADLIVNYTPGLKKLVLPHVHGGFWEAYSVVREFIHEVLRKELTRDAADVYFTGHSLGGALTTIAALDFKIHSLPRIDAFMKYCSKNDRSVSEGIFNFRDPRKVIQVGMYSFGCPRVGNAAFAELFDKNVKDGFRVNVDGDPVCAVPFSNAGFKHVGTEALIDSVGAGSIIIDSSFIERRLRNRTKSSVSVHKLSAYRKGLLGIKEASRRIKEMVDKDASGNAKRDILALTLAVAPLLNEGGATDTTLFDENKEMAPNESDKNITEGQNTRLSDLEYKNLNGNKGVISRVTRMITGVHGNDIEKILSEDTVVRRAYSENSPSKTSSRLQNYGNYDSLNHDRTPISGTSDVKKAKEDVGDYSRISGQDQVLDQSERLNDITAITDGTEFS